MSGNGVNRREFIGGAGLAAGGIAVSAAMPWLAAPVGAEQPTLAMLSDWSIDDMWGAAYPRYAERIEYPRPREQMAASAAAGSIGTLFYV